MNGTDWIKRLKAAACGSPAQLLIPVVYRKYPYRFELRNGDCGVWITGADNLADARVQLEAIYRDRLVSVTSTQPPLKDSTL